MLDEDAEGPFALAGIVEVTDPAALELKVLFGGDQKEAPSQYYLVRISGTRVSLSKVDGKRTVELGVGGEIPRPSKGQKVEFALHRDDWRMALIWDRRVVVKAYDNEFCGPAVGYDAVTGATVEEAWLQLVGDIDKGDTFEREEGAKDEWERLSGSWQLISLREDRQKGQMQADKAANAFSYYGTAEGAGLAAMGSWYWRNCRLSLAVRARGQEGAVGLAFYVQDKENYLLLRWDNRFTSAEGGPHLRLLSVVDGEQETLAERADGYFPDQWYRLEARVCDERAYCFVDGQLILDAFTPLFGQGKAGMYVEGKQGVWFDDVRVVNWSNMLEDFDEEHPGKWTAIEGKWEISRGAARPREAGPCLLITGSASWSGYAFSAQVEDAAQGVGLAACYKGPEDAYVFRWAGRRAPVPYAGQAQLLRLTSDGMKVLAEKPLPSGLSASGLATVLVETDYIAGLLGGRRVVDAVVPAPAGGAVGLYAEGRLGARFDNARVELLPERTVARVTKEFADAKQHFEMVEWASTRHPWVKPDDASPKVWWTKGDYYGPLEVRFELQQIGQVAGTMSVAIEAEKGEASKGARLAVTATKGSKTLSLKLTADGKELGSAEVEAEGETCPISLARRGESLVVTVDGRTVVKVVWR